MPSGEVIVFYKYAGPVPPPGFDIVFLQLAGYLSSFPLTMGEGWDGRRLREPLARRGVDIMDIPPTLILPLRGGRKLFFLTQLGYKFV
jgi:hypothetical protein